jgi:hypothetical protein
MTVVAEATPNQAVQSSLSQERARIPRTIKCATEYRRDIVEAEVSQVEPQRLVECLLGRDLDGLGLIPELEFRAWLDAALTRADDRALFGLPHPAGGEQGD